MQAFQNTLAPETCAKLAAFNATMQVRSALKRGHNLGMTFTPEMIANPAIFAALISLAEVVAAETGNEFPFD